MPTPECGLWYWLYIVSVTVGIVGLLLSIKLDDFAKDLQRAWYWEGM